MLLSDVATPAPVVDLDRLERNLDRAATYAARHGLALRPHVKTHKASVVAKQQLARGAAGLSCATPRELEVMREVGSDLLLMHAPVGAAKLERLMQLPPDTALTVAVDSVAALDGLAAAAAQAGRAVGVYVEIDLGLHRVGVATPADAVALARAVRTRAPLEYAGLCFYPGHLREPLTSGDPALAALAHHLDEFLQALDDAGASPAVVSGGSTPTIWHSHEVPRVTEIRPGTYVYNDRTTAAIGACAWEDCALTVLATVVSTAVPGQAVLDAGTKSLGREPVRGAAGEGYGQLLEHPDVLVTKMWEEHGVVDLSRSDWRPQVGERVRIVPNHVCIVTHLFDTVHGARGDVIDTTWPIAARGRERQSAPEMQLTES
jgi:D-serine deaminase-like pyridoxal phosphate-dependent protein